MSSLPKLRILPKLRVLLVLLVLRLTVLTARSSGTGRILSTGSIGRPLPAVDTEFKWEFVDKAGTRAYARMLLLQLIFVLELDLRAWGYILLRLAAGSWGGREGHGWVGEAELGEVVEVGQTEDDGRRAMLCWVSASGR